MDNATPRGVLLACADDEVVSRLHQILSSTGFHIYHTRGSADVHPADPIDLGVVALDDATDFLVAWRQSPRTSPLPVLLLSDRAFPEADSFLPPDASAESVLAQVKLLLRLRCSEQSNRAQEARLQDLLDHAPIAVSVKDTRGRYLLVNRSWESMFLRSRQQVLGKTVHDVFPIDEAERLDNHYQTAARDGQPVEYEEVAELPDGPHTFLKTKFFLRHDDAWAICGITSDITGRKKVEEDLRNSEALYHSLVETLPVCIMRKDMHGRFTFVNSSFCVELRRTPEEIIGRTDHDFYPPALADKYVRDDRHVVEQLTVFEAIEEHTTAEGEVRYVHVIKSPLFDSGGRVIGIQGIFWDVTEGKKAQEELANASADREIARRVQRRLFPSPKAPVLALARAAGFDAAGVSYPVEAIGGDYYDFIPLADAELGVAVGDVSGHGTGPALLMAITRSYLHGCARELNDPAVVLERVNQLIANDIEGDRYITLMLARLDLRRRTLTYASAGHATAYVVDAANRIKYALESTGVPLGIHAASRFAQSDALPLAEGDVVVLLTDGIADARDPSRQTFGIKRVLELVRVYRQASAAEMVDNLYHAARAFSQNQPQLDDLTAVVVKVS